MTDLRMSLREASEATGIPANTLRSRYKAGKLRGERDNAGRLFVWIDPAAQGSKSKASNSSKQVRSDGELEALKGHIETLQVQLAAADARAADWQTKAETAQAENADLWQRFTEHLMMREPPRSWWDRVRGR